MESRELSSCSWPCHCNNDSDSCHYQEEEKLKLGCESTFSWKPNKTEEQQTGRRLMWTMGNPEGGQHWKKRLWGFTEPAACCLSSSLGRMLKVVGFCSTSLSPSTQFSDDLTYSMLAKFLKGRIKRHSYFHPEEAIFISKMVHIMHFFYICCAMENNLLCLFKTRTKPDFGALEKG